MEMGGQFVAAWALMTMKHLPSDLQSTVATLLERHLENAKEWFPHEFVPWSRGRDFVGTDEWDPNEVKLSEATQKSRPRGCEESRRTRPTSTASLPAAISGVG